MIQPPADCAIAHNERPSNGVTGMFANSMSSRHRMLTAAMVFPLGSKSLPERMHAALGAEPMLDDVLVERVRACVFVWRKQFQLFARDEPHESTLASADGAVAGHRTSERSFELKGDGAAVTASFVEHSLSPIEVIEVACRRGKLSTTSAAAHA